MTDSTRRSFLKASAAAGVSAYVGASFSVPAAASTPPLKADVFPALQDQGEPHPPYLGLATSLTEEHRYAGGLGGAVAELLAVENPTRMRMVAMPDEFAVVGPTVPLRAKYGMSADAIVAACKALMQ